MTGCKEIDDYIRLVREGEYPVCKWQLLLCDFVERVFASEEYGNVMLVRPRDEMRRIPVITSGFANHRFVWGDSPVMRWMTNNSKTVTSPAGNITYGKIEPKSRKTDTFKAFVAAECVSDILDGYAETAPQADLTAAAGVWTYEGS